MDLFGGEELYILKNCYTPITCTAPAISSILTGLYPTSHGVTYHGLQVLSDDFLRFPEVLKRIGYSTIFATSGFNLARVPRLGLSKGFDTVMEIPGSNVKPIVPLPSGILEERINGPTFMLLHTYATHAPYGCYHKPPYISDQQCHFAAPYLDRLRELSDMWIPGLFNFLRENKFI